MCGFGRTSDNFSNINIKFRPGFCELFGAFFCWPMGHLLVSLTCAKKNGEEIETKMGELVHRYASRFER